MVERDVINAESCYQENGEEVRRQEAREEVRAAKVVAKKAMRKGAVKKAAAKKSARKVVAKKATRKGRGEESRPRRRPCCQARASKRKKATRQCRPRIVRHVARRLIGLRVPTYRLIRRGCRRFGLA